MKDLYHVLGVSEDATQAEIRTAYRQRARAVHPDCSDEDGQSFRELQEAYDVLGNPVRREAYDRRRRRSSRPPQRPQGEWRPAGPSFDESDTLLSQLRRHFDQQSTPRGQWPTGAGGLRVRVRITPREARDGGYLRFRLSVPEACARCGGTGLTGLYHCAGCRGTGVVQEQVPVEIAFPPGMRDGQQAEVSLAALGLEGVSLQLSFAVSR